MCSNTQEFIWNDVRPANSSDQFSPLLPLILTPLMKPFVLVVAHHGGPAGDPPGTTVKTIVSCMIWWSERQRRDHSPERNSHSSEVTLNFICSTWCSQRHHTLWFAIKSAGFWAQWLVSHQAQHSSPGCDYTHVVSNGKWNWSFVMLIWKLWNLN